MGGTPARGCLIGVAGLVEGAGEGRDPRVPPRLHLRPGPDLAGEHASTATVVLVKHDDEYEITAFHNTLVTG